MSYVTKNQTSLVLIVIVVTTIMIAGSIATSTDNAFAWRNHFGHGHFGHGHFGHGHFGHGHFGSFGNFGPYGFFGPYGRSHTHQSIDQSSDQRQRSFCLSAGAFSPITTSCNNIAASTNTNTGGNGAFSDNSGNSRTGQEIDQSGHQHQTSFCLSAGAFSPITASCNNIAVHGNTNTGGNGAATTG